MNVQFFAIPRSRAILWALKIHRTLVQIATTIIFRCGDQQSKGIYKSEKKIASKLHSNYGRNQEKPH